MRVKELEYENKASQDIIKMRTEES